MNNCLAQTVVCMIDNPKVAQWLESNETPNFNNSTLISFHVLGKHFDDGKPVDRCIVFVFSHITLSCFSRSDGSVGSLAADEIRLRNLSLGTRRWVLHREAVILIRSLALVGSSARCSLPEQAPTMPLQSSSFFGNLEESRC